MTSLDIQLWIINTFDLPKISGFRDESYQPVKKEWILGEYYDFYKKALDVMGLEYNDQFLCNKFSSLFCGLCQLCYAKHYGGTDKPQSLAIANFCYVVDPTLNHCLVVCKTKHSYFFVEPQNGKEVKLTQDEEHSCFEVNAG